jgi:hypothetical protein
VKNSTLQYVAKRLSQFDDAECLAAVDLVRSALASIHAFTRSAEAEHALYHTLWGHITRALDVGNYTPAQADVLGALETEMAGHTLAIRLSLGWLARSATAPENFPALPALKKHHDN